MNRLGKAASVIVFLSAALFAGVLLRPGSITGNFGDIFFHYYPLKFLSTESLIRGEVPFWNPYIFAGHPVLANPQSALFYPFSALFYFFPLHTAFNWFFAAHFALAGIFMFLFLASSGCSRTAGLAGALAFAFSSFLVYCVPAGHPAALSGYIWLPLVMLFFGRIASGRDDTAVIAAGVALSFQFLSGHFQPVYCSIVVIALHFTFNGFKYWRSLLAVSACALALSSCQLLPTLELSRVIEKGFWPGLVANYSLPVKNLVSVILPGYFGNVIDGNFAFRDNASYFFERHAVYFGIVPFLLAAAGFIAALRKKQYFYPLLLAAGLVLSTGIYAKSDFLYGHIPGLSFLRVPARFYAVALFAMIALAGPAWDGLAALAPRRASALLKAALLAVIAADLFAWDMKFVYAQDISSYRKPPAAEVCTGPEFRIATEPDRMAPNRSMLYHQYNLNGYEAFFLENFVKYVGLQEKRVFNATGLARTDLASPLARGLSVGYYVNAGPRGLEVRRDPKALPRVYLAKRAVVIPDGEVFEQIDYLAKTKYAPDEEVLLSGIPDGIPQGTPSGRILSYSSGAQRLSAEADLPQGGVLIFSEIFYPGWKAWAGSRETRVVPADKALRAVLLRPGKYEGAGRITLMMRPVSWSFGLFGTLLALAAVALIFAFPGFLTTIRNIDMMNKQ